MFCSGGAGSVHPSVVPGRGRRPAAFGSQHSVQSSLPAAPGDYGTHAADPAGLTR